MNKAFIKIYYIILISAFSMGCTNAPDQRPLPRMYPKIVFPEKRNIKFDEDLCNMTFIYPDYLKYVRDTSFFESAPLHPCWFDLDSKELNTTIHFSYYPITNRASFDKLVNDVFKMVGEHNIRASFRAEEPIKNEKKDAFGLEFEIEGEVASPLQFFLTDSTRNFVRASLYFNAKVNPDSTQVIYDFVREDIDQIIKSWQWNESP